MTSLFLNNVLNNEIPGVLILAFLHSLWQGLLLSILAWISLQVTKKWSPAARYNLLVIFLFSFLVSVVLTFFNVSMDQEMITAGQLIVSAPVSQGDDYFFQPFLTWCTSNASWIFLLWFFFFLFKVTQLFRGLIAVDKLKKTGVYRPSSQWLKKIDELRSALHIRSRIGLHESSLIRQPVVIGIFKPLILVPIGFLNGLRAVEVEAILLHELAHIKRNDYLVNLFQNLLETIFFFNPFLCWLSEMIRDEREHCCDTLAIGHTKNKKVFLQALISFHENSAMSSSYAMGLMSNKGLLIKRVDRIMKGDSRASSVAEKLTLIICYSALFIGLVSFSLLNNDHVMLKTNTGADIKPVAAVALPGNSIEPDTIPPNKKESKEFMDGYRAAQQYLKNRSGSTSTAKHKLEQQYADEFIPPVTEKVRDNKATIQSIPPVEQKKKIEQQYADESITFITEPGYGITTTVTQKDHDDLKTGNTKKQKESALIKLPVTKSQTALSQSPGVVTREANDKKKIEQALIAVEKN